MMAGATTSTTGQERGNGQSHRRVLPTGEKEAAASSVELLPVMTGAAA